MGLFYEGGCGYFVDNSVSIVSVHEKLETHKAYKQRYKSPERKCVS